MKNVIPCCLLAKWMPDAVCQKLHCPDTHHCLMSNSIMWSIQHDVNTFSICSGRLRLFQFSRNSHLHFNVPKKYIQCLFEQTPSSYPKPFLFHVHCHTLNSTNQHHPCRDDWYNLSSMDHAIHLKLSCHTENRIHYMAREKSAEKVFYGPIVKCVFLCVELFPPTWFLLWNMNMFPFASLSFCCLVVKVVNLALVSSCVYHQLWNELR